jgi:ParB/RepB/Spo0J family partition protein
MRVDIVNPKEIWSKERFRTDYGELDDLVTSIKKYGIIQPLAVSEMNGGAGRLYLLLAGGRRYQAATLAGLKEVPVRIYEDELNDLQLRSIELEENVRRKDLTFIEECNLKREIHNIQVALHGEKISTSPNASGHSLRNTAKLLDKSHASVVQDIKLANAMESFPDLQWNKCKNKSDAVKMFNKFEEKIVRSDLADKAGKLLGKTPKKLIDSYIVGDFFEKVKSIPDNSIDFMEIDPPYSIDLPGMKDKDNYAINYGDAYNEVDNIDYLEFMQKTLSEAYRIMNDHSWLILWFAPDPWFDIMYHILVNEGFKTRRLCGIWTKPNGQTRHPEVYLGNNFEMFYYARKGDAKINLDKRGRSNIFNFPPVFPAHKIHPTERPVELIEELLSVFAWEGSRVVVPFAGSGNTLRAAHNKKMHPIGYDLSKEYKDAFVSRIITNEEGEEK